MKTSVTWSDYGPDAHTLSDAYVSFVNEYGSYRERMVEDATNMALILAEAERTLSEQELDRLRRELRIEDDGSAQFSISYSVEV